MIPTRNKKKTLKATVDEMRNFALIYVEKYAPSKQQLKTYLLKKYMKHYVSKVKKEDIYKLIDIVLSDLEKKKFLYKGELNFRPFYSTLEGFTEEINISNLHKIIERFVCAL